MPFGAIEFRISSVDAGRLNQHIAGELIATLDAVAANGTPSPGSGLCWVTVEATVKESDWYRQCSVSLVESAANAGSGSTPVATDGTDDSQAATPTMPRLSSYTDLRSNGPLFHSLKSRAESSKRAITDRSWNRGEEVLLLPFFVTQRENEQVPGAQDGSSSRFHATDVPPAGEPTPTGSELQPAVQIGHRYVLRLHADAAPSLSSGSDEVDRGVAAIVADEVEIDGVTVAALLLAAAENSARTSPLEKEEDADGLDGPKLRSGLSAKSRPLVVTQLRGNRGHFNLEVRYIPLDYLLALPAPTSEATSAGGATSATLALTTLSWRNGDDSTSPRASEGRPPLPSATGTASSDAGGSSVQSPQREARASSRVESQQGQAKTTVRTGELYSSRQQSFRYGEFPLSEYAAMVTLAQSLTTLHAWWMARQRDSANPGGAHRSSHRLSRAGSIHGLGDSAVDRGDAASVHSSGHGSATASMRSRARGQKDAADRNKPPKPCRLSKRLLQFLRNPKHALRWEQLSVLDLSQDIVGDSGYPIVLEIASQCRSLVSLNVDSNSLTLPSATLTFTALRHHPTLQHFSAKNNLFYESAGEDLLRLIKVNRKIVSFSLEGNHLSEYLTRRIEKQLAVNQHEQDAEPFNPLSPMYGYLNNFYALEKVLPTACWTQLKRIWLVLCSGPAADLSNVEDALNSTTTSNTFLSSTITSRDNGAIVGGRSSYRSKKQAMELEELFSSLDPTIPVLVTTPFFRQVVEATQVGFATKFEDPWIRRVFSEASNAMVPILTGAKQLNKTIVRILSEGENDQLPSSAPRESNDLDDAENVAPADEQQDEEAADAEDADYRGSFYPNSFVKLWFLPLRVACECPHRWSDAIKIVRCLGATHAALGVQPHHYTAASQCLLKSLVANAGPTVMDADARAAWTQFLMLVTRVALSGTDRMA
jgi:hypothetical protein